VKNFRVILSNGEQHKYLGQSRQEVFDQAVYEDGIDRDRIRRIVRVGVETAGRPRQAA